MNWYQRTVARGWWLLILAFVAAAAWGAWLTPRVAVEASSDLLLDEHDGDLAYYNLSRAEWQTDEYLVVCCHRAEGWFTPDALGLLLEFVHAIRQAPHAGAVWAITTVPLLRNVPGAAMPVPIRLEGPDGRLNPKADLARAREELTQHTQALGNLISADATDTIVLVYLDVGAESVALEKRRTHLKGLPDDPAAQRELAEVEPAYQAAATEVRRRRGVFVEAVRTLQAEWAPRFGEPVRVSGVPFINVLLMEHIRSDMSSFGVLALAMFTVAYLLIYRRPRWAVLPIATCVVPVVLLCGFLVTIDRPITVVTANMPVLLFVLTLPYTVYFIERWRERRAVDPAEGAIESAVRAPVEMWAPCAFSCLSTMAGTAAHIPSGINPVRTFGWVMTVLTPVGLATVMLFLPAIVSRLRPLAVTSASMSRGLGAPLRALITLVLRAPLLVVALSLAILGVSIWGVTKVTAETKFIDYFWPQSPIYQGLQYIDTKMSGTTPLEVILTAEQPGYFRTPQGFAALDAVARFFDQVPETGNVRSFKTLADEAKKALPKASHDWVVGIVRGVAKDQVAEFCNKDFTVARVLVRMRETAPTLNRARIIADLKAHLAARADAELAGLTARPTGVFVLYSNMLNSILTATRETFILVVIAILVMLALLFRSPLMAILVMLPQVLPVLLVLGVMGFTGIALDMVTVIIASVAMGVGIDAAIQYASRYRRELDACGDVAEAVRRSHATIGRAILVATSIMFAGFVLLMFSNFRPTFWFGMFTGLAILMGLFASLTTLPAMFVLTGYPRPRRKARTEPLSAER